MRNARLARRGQTAKQWLTEQGISEKSYYYWQRKIRLEAYDERKKPNALLKAQGNLSVASAEIPFAVERDPLRTERFEPAAIIRIGCSATYFHIKISG